MPPNIPLGRRALKILAPLLLLVLLPLQGSIQSAPSAAADTSRAARTPKVFMKLEKQQVTPKQRAHVKIALSARSARSQEPGTLRSAGLGTGKVMVAITGGGGKYERVSAKLVKGKAVLRVPKLPRGIYKVRATFLGNALLGQARSEVRMLKVVHSTTTTPPSTGFPDASNTGPTGTLTAYTGPCTITTAGTVIDSKVINCVPLQISTIGVVVRNSKINGAVRVGVQDDYNPATVSDPEGDDPIRVTILDSEIDATAAAGSGFRPISFSHYIVRNSYLHGGFSGAECHNACTIEDSYVHGFGEHSSGMRILRNGTLRGNTIWCEPNPNSDEDGNGVPDEDGGCSGNLTMYEEFGVPHHNLVEHNYFPAGLFWFSLKFNGNDNGTIKIVGNTFGIPKPGAGLADDWDAKSTNVWSGNTLTNGRVASP